jgi:hypothetical protein
MAKESQEEMDAFIESQIKVAVDTYEERKVADTPIWVIERLLPMKEFGKLPIKVQFLLLTQLEKIDKYTFQIDLIREHLDRTPL